MSDLNTTDESTSLNLTLKPTYCAIDKTLEDAEELYPATFDVTHFNQAIFSARRLPDRVHYRIVKCRHCGLVRSDPVLADTAILAKLYEQSSFTYDEEMENIRDTYAKYLKLLEAHGVSKGTLIEIGGGNGFFLEAALQQGYEKVYNVEPSHDAVNAAPPHLRDFMICDVMRPGLFPPSSVDVICFFQVFDHMPEPEELLKTCKDILRPGGFMLFLNHNVDAWSARLLGEKSPIIDIEHTYLYNPTTLKKIIELTSMKVTEQGVALNKYSLHYIARLLPLPKIVKSNLLFILKRIPLGRLSLSVPLGNLYTIARKL